MYKRAKKKQNTKQSIPNIDINDAISISERLSKITKGSTISEEDEKILQQGAKLIELLITIYGVWSKSKKRMGNLLKMVFGNRSEKLKDLGDGFSKGKKNDDLVASEGSNDPNNKKKRKGGGGKNSADDYTAAAEIECKLDDDKLPGETCPECKDNKLFEIDPKKVIRLVGNAPVTAFKFFQQQTKCICGALFTADVGDEFREVYNGDKYSPSALASIMILKYLMGTSFGKLEKIQKMGGIPLPATTQMNKIKIMALPMVQSIVVVLSTLAANAHSLAFDDTRIKTLEKRKTKNGNETHNGHGTAIIADSFDDQNNKIILFDFNVNKHAGEVICELLAKRERDALPLLISDCLPAYDVCKKSGVDVNCNTHARRKVVEEDPQRKTYLGYTILECYKEIYKNDSYCKNNNLTDIERMKYHQDNSNTQFEKIKIIFDIVTGKDVPQAVRQNFSIPNYLCPEEPNSDLYRTAEYFLDRYEALTRVMDLPGVPLDTNHVERVIKSIILLRKNSLFFHNHFSAQYSADILSLLETANHSQVNVFDYMDYLLSHKKQVMESPANYLPWLYKKTNEEKKKYWERCNEIKKSPSSSEEYLAGVSVHSSA